MTPRLDMIGIVTQDLGASLDFYRQLDLDIPSDAENDAHVEVALPNGLRLAWDPTSTIESFDESLTTPAGSPRIALAFLCESPSDVDDTFHRLVQAGAHGRLDPWDAPWGQRYATLHDPTATASTSSHPSHPEPGSRLADSSGRVEQLRQQSW